MTRYIDARNPNVTDEEVLALVTGQAKPFPQSYYASEEEIVEKKNSCFEGDAEGLTVEDWEEAGDHFSCPVSKWEFLSLPTGLA